jgi:hypothetical protein
MKYNVRKLLEQDVDLDIYDDVCEELGIAFCGPVKLTEEGLKRFCGCLDFPVSYYPDDGFAVVHIDAPEGIWQKNLHSVKELFEAMAGFCKVSDYERWFKAV